MNFVCGNNTEERKVSRNIDKDLSNWKKEYKKATQILLLGAGESGKTTIIKQMKILNQNGFSDQEKMERVPFIRKNISTAIVTLVKQLKILNVSLEEQSEEIQNALHYIETLDSNGEIYPQDKIFWDSAAKLWSDKGIQKVYLMQGKYHLIDCAKYFLDRMEVVKEESYVPSVKDVLHCRTRTVGIQKIEFDVKIPRKDGGGAASFWMFDVGGQRGERKKWIQVFDGIDAILFLVSSSCFDSVIEEDNKTNRLREAIDIFKNVWHSRFVKRAGFILFLNKQDILENKIVNQGKSILPYFPEYDDYSLDEREKSMSENGDYQRTKCFIRDQFLDVTRKKQSNTTHSIAPGVVVEVEESDRECYPHFIVATDTKNVEHVFKDVYRMILNSTLKDFGVKQFIRNEKNGSFVEFDESNTVYLIE